MYGKNKMTSHSGFLSQSEQFIGSSNKQEGKFKNYSKNPKYHMEDMSKILKSKNNLLYTIIVNHNVKIIQEIINNSE